MLRAAGSAAGMAHTLRAWGAARCGRQDEPSRRTGVRCSKTDVSLVGFALQLIAHVPFTTSTWNARSLFAGIRTPTWRRTQNPSLLDDLFEKSEVFVLLGYKGMCAEVCPLSSSHVYHRMFTEVELRSGSSRDGCRVLAV